MLVRSLAVGPVTSLLSLLSHDTPVRHELEICVSVSAIVSAVGPSFQCEPYDGFSAQETEATGAQRLQLSTAEYVSKQPTAEYL